MKILSYEPNNAGIELLTDQGKLFVQGINDAVIRCVYTKAAAVLRPSRLVVTQAGSMNLEICEADSTVVIQTARVSLNIDRKLGRFTWVNNNTGTTLLKEAGKSLVKKDNIKYSTNGEAPVIRRVKTVDGERNFIENLRPVIAGHTYRGKLSFDWADDEGIYGLGQGEEGVYNYRGHNQYLYQHNMRIPIPFFVSDRGYGVFVDCGSIMTFQDDHNGSYLFMDTVDQLDYYFIFGETIDEIIHGYRTVTGKAVLLPKWAFGYIQSKEAYHTAAEMIETARMYREHSVPIDCIVQDWNTWEAGDWGQKTVDKARYPNLSEMNDAIHALNIHTMVSVWPNMNPGGKNHQEFLAAGYLLEDYSTYNAFAEKAREIYWKQANEELFSSGFDAWWCDSTEPFSGPDWGGEELREPWERYNIVGEEHKKYLGAAQSNEYALVHAQGMYEGQRRTNPDKRVLNLTRSGYAGSQRYGTVLWSGDISATWEEFRIQIREGLNFALSGMPFWTVDIGAFFVVKEAWQKRGCGNHNNPNRLWFWRGGFEDGVDDLGYRELYVRWLQYGTFLPMFRSHGTDTPREIWNFGEKGQPYYDTIKKYIKLRYRLMPYIYSLAGQVWLNDQTMHRSLLFDFAADETARQIWDQFMLGKEMLVCPVVEAMYYEANNQPIEHKETRSCYLPAGVLWHDYWSEAVFDGGQWLEADASLTQIPLYIRAGSIIPMTKGLQYATAEINKPLEIHVYAGKDGSFLLYEDEDNNYNYEHGAYSTIEFSWNEKNKIVTIGKRCGSFSGMKARREFCICVNRMKTVVQYHGEAIEVADVSMPAHDNPGAKPRFVF